jgi:hypothetical protein
MMLSKRLLDPILANEALTRGLGDAEARMLVEWLVEEADRRAALADKGEGDADVGSREVLALCRWARAVSRFVYLWCHAGLPGPAIQLAASERFGWPLPATWQEPDELMEQILTWESQHRCPALAA